MSDGWSKTPSIIIQAYIDHSGIIKIFVRTNLFGSLGNYVFTKVILLVTHG